MGYIGNIIRTYRARGIIVDRIGVLVDNDISLYLTSSRSTLLNTISSIYPIRFRRTRPTFSLTGPLGLSGFSSPTSDSIVSRGGSGASIHSYNDDEGSLFGNIEVLIIILG